MNIPVETESDMSADKFAQRFHNGARIKVKVCNCEQYSTDGHMKTIMLKEQELKIKFSVITP